MYNTHKKTGCSFTGQSVFIMGGMGIMQKGENDKEKFKISVFTSD